MSDARPADCYCHSRDQGLPCYPCFREGHERPNPDAPDPLQPNA